MIAKRIPRSGATSSVAKLVRYVVDAQGREDPRSWTNTAEYILATRSNGEKVGGVRVTNCHSTEPVGATLEILATQALNTRSKADKTYHLVFSFPPGEQPPMATLHAVEDELCAAIGLSDHQRVSAVHIDTEHLHVHVAINKVHPTTYRNIEPYYDHKRLMEACERLEIQFGLQPTNHGRDVVNNRRRQQHQERVNEQYRDSDRARRDGRVPDTLDPNSQQWKSLSALRESNLSWNPTRQAPGKLHDLPKLSSIRVVRITTGGEVLLQDHARRSVVDRGPAGAGGVRRPSHGGSAATGAAVEGINEGLKLPTRAADMEAYSGEESLLSWVKSTAGDRLESAGSWEDLHSVLGEMGLEIRPRGAGLVIYDPQQRIGIRPSQVSRALSKSALEARLGSYTPPKFGVQSAMRYDRRPREKGPSSTALYAAFQRERDATQAKRNSELTRIKAQGAALYGRARASYAAKRAAMKLMRGTPRHIKRVAYQTLRAEHMTSIAKIRSDLAKARAAAIGATPAKSWEQHLGQLAAQGDQDAVLLLRQRIKRHLKDNLDLLQGSDPERARAIVFKHLNPRTARSGAIHYSLKGGGSVIDRGVDVRAVGYHSTTLFVALNLASSKFPNQPLIVKGTEEFRVQIAELAGLQSFKLTFADPVLESLRQRAAAEAAAEKRRSAQRPAQPQERMDTKSNATAMAVSEPVADSQNAERAPVRDGRIRDAVPTSGATDSISPAAKEWIEKRNETARRVSDINYVREWLTRDAGEATYRGLRRMTDGTEVVLLDRGGETLVKQVTAAVGAKASKFKVGQVVELDRRGRFIDTSRGRRR